MKENIVFMILLQLILIGLNAVFACAEIAVISMNDSKLAKLAASGDKRALRLEKLTSQPARFLATIQVAITLSGFLGSAFAAENFSDVLVNWLLSLGVRIPVATLDAIAVVIITLILSYFTLIFGELVPKRVAMRKAEVLALGMSAMISTIAKVFAPVVWLLTASTNGVLRLLGIDPNAEEEEVSEEEIRMLVDVGSEKGTIDHEEKQLIQNVFEFDDLTAGEIVTHRKDLSILWLEETVEEWEETIHSSRHTLYPICEETPDNVIGILNAKDYFCMGNKEKSILLRQVMKPAYFVPEYIKADVLFRNMKRDGNSLAVVLDEYGGMVGIVTMNDLVEQLVGEFTSTEHDQEQVTLIEQMDIGVWKIHGEATLAMVSEVLGIRLISEDYDTFNGLIFTALGAIPQDGTTVEVETNELLIQVTQVYNHQVEAAMVSLK